MCRFWRPLAGVLCSAVFWAGGLSVFGADDTAFRAVTGKPVQAAPAAPDVPEEMNITEPEKSSRTDDYYEVASPAQGTILVESSRFPVEPKGLYRFKMNACWLGSGGSLPAGITGVTNDYLPEETEYPATPCSQIIRMPDGENEACLSVGRWDSTRTVRFTMPELIPVCPIYAGIPSAENKITEISVKSDGKPLDGVTVSDGIYSAVTEGGKALLGSSAAGVFLPLGNSEQIDGSSYRFKMFSALGDGNFDRNLEFSNAQFNSTRWCLTNNEEVIYKFHLQPVRIGEGEQPKAIQFANAAVQVNAPIVFGGRCVVEMSIDQETWKRVGSTETTENIQGAPDAFFTQPVDTFYVRCRAENTDTEADFQIYDLEVTATLDCADFQGNGATYFADAADTDTADNADTDAAGQKAGCSVCPLFIKDQMLYSAVTNESDQPVDWDGKGTISLSVDDQEPVSIDEPAQLFGTAGPIPAKGRVIAVQNFAAAKRGEKRKISCAFDRNFVFEKNLFPNFIQDYTASVADLACSSAGVNLSWCEADRKVPRDPILVEYQEAAPVKIAAPRNDFEAFQVVVRPKQSLSGLCAEASELTGPGGAVIDASNIQVRYGYYHKVEIPTDGTCAPGWYVDALVPMSAGSDGNGKPICIQANENQPVFVTVYVPFETPAGDYTGTLTLSDADGTFQASVPFMLTVWDFDQPAKNRFETAYGFWTWNIWDYQNAKTEEERRAIWVKYQKDASDHRISFYDPVPMDAIGVTFDSETLTAQFDFDRFDAEMTRILSQYNITNFMLPVTGLRGGTNAEGEEVGELAGFLEGTPEYDALMTDYLGKLQAHLAEKGWLDMCYCYWIDEPEEKDYPFVASGFGKMKKYGPGIGRMLTEQPGDGLCGALDAAGGDVTIWCPISDAFSIEEAQKRKAKGERFWWYVCTGPKAPYCTEFTDHPGHELRLWHWQAFERGIVGSLIWVTNYWHSPEAFPNSYQDPYLDPMCYVTDSRMAPGTKSYWGNGDGRLLYPPLAASVPGKNGGEAVFDDPVDSIRWEELREGIEDYEMLLTLRERFEAKKADLTAGKSEEIEKLFDFSDLTASMTSFTDDPKMILKHREKIAEAILRLGK